MDLGVDEARGVGVGVAATLKARCCLMSF